uniref:BHLH domain-containing protein n=1 Tax=Oryza punctata TaxID=4537 RepID=A0A0E0MPB6_ORYPU
MANCYNDIDAGDMFVASDDYSAGGGGAGDLFDMVWPGRRRRRGEDNTGGCLPLSPPPPDVLLPSGDEIPMAAWFYPPTVRDEELAVDQLPAGGDGGGGGHVVGVEDQPVAVAEDDSGERRTEKGTRSESINERKTSRARRSSRYSQTHSLTERKRRCTINEKLKTLQQLVPGCDKSNQASTLDKTIRYMKSLQQHVQAMSVGCSMKPAAAAAAAGVSYPFLQPPPYVRPAIAAGATAPAGMVPRPPPSMVPFAGPPVLPLVVHHPAPLMMMPAPAPLMIYPAAGVAGPSNITAERMKD